ncbi:phytase [Amycolatopsis jejuensis]|uniref:phytase n=1 Tax=Amycolatopsis jejuensis TaxID=330084 RepID=UPI00052615A0|nr:phytase [Amycolatopsis jejuensis]
MRYRKSWTLPAVLVLAVPLLTASLGHADTVVTAYPTVETPATFDDDAGGNVDSDDPEVWINPDDTARSLVLGAEKTAGMSVFDLHGAVVQHIPAAPPPRPGDEAGRLNNLDVLYDVPIGGHHEDIAVVSDRGLDKLHVFKIDRKAKHAKPVTEITAADTPYLFSADQDEVNSKNTAYGVTTWKAGDGTVYVIATREHRTDLALFKLIPKEDGTVGYELVRRAALPSSFTLPDGSSWTPCDKPGRGPQAEGMAVDEDRGLVYLAQEGVGIWRARADLKSFEPVLIDKVKEYGVPATYDAAKRKCVPGTDPGYGGKHLRADVEGLSIYHRGDGKGYLIASSQGDSTFAVYDRVPDNDYVGQFRIGDGPSVDGTQNTDSFFVTNVPVGQFRQGLMVVQDGDNTPHQVDENGKVRTSTNFKYVPWEAVANAFPKHLKIDPDGWHPRN